MLIVCSIWSKAIFDIKHAVLQTLNITRSITPEMITAWQEQNAGQTSSGAFLIRIQNWWWSFYLSCHIIRDIHKAARMAHCDNIVCKNLYVCKISYGLV